jgi:hypothetical protein
MESMVASASVLGGLKEPDDVAVGVCHRGHQPATDVADRLLFGSAGGEGLREVVLDALASRSRARSSFAVAVRGPRPTFLALLDPGVLPRTDDAMCRWARRRRSSQHRPSPRPSPGGPVSRSLFSSTTSPLLVRRLTRLPAGEAGRPGRRTRSWWSPQSSKACAPMLRSDAKAQVADLPKCKVQSAGGR